jgi:hypothetical protein
VKIRKEFLLSKVPTADSAFAGRRLCRHGLWLGRCRVNSIPQYLLNRSRMQLEGLVIAGDCEEVGATIRDQMQNFLIGGDAECELAECQEFAWLAKKLANHFSNHLSSEPVPIHDFPSHRTSSEHNCIQSCSSFSIAAMIRAATLLNLSLWRGVSTASPFCADRASRTALCRPTALIAAASSLMVG